MSLKGVFVKHNIIKYLFISFFCFQALSAESEKSESERSGEFTRYYEVLGLSGNVSIEAFQEAWRKHHYEVFGLTQDATEKEIKKAYRKIMNREHPDKSLSDEKIAEEVRKEFESKRNIFGSLESQNEKIASEITRRILERETIPRLITETNVLLMDPLKRRQYDEYLRRGRRGSAPDFDRPTSPSFEDTIQSMRKQHRPNTLNLAGDWKIEFMQGEIEINNVQIKKTETYTGRFWTFSKENSKVTLFQSRGGTFYFEPLGPHNFAIFSLGSANNILDFLSTATRSLHGFEQLNNELRSPVLEELFQRRMFRNHTTDMYLGMLNSFNFQTGNYIIGANLIGQFTTYIENTITGERSTVTEQNEHPAEERNNTAEERSASTEQNERSAEGRNNTTAERSNTPTAERNSSIAGSIPSQLTSRSQELSENVSQFSDRRGTHSQELSDFSPKKISEMSLEEVVRLLEAEHIHQQSSGYLGHMKNTVLRFPKEVLIFYAMQWVVTSSFANESDPFVHANNIDMLTDPVGLLSFAAFVSVSSTVSYGGARTGQFLAKEYNSVLNLLGKEISETHARPPKLNRARAAALNASMRLASLLTTPLALGLGMLASNALHEYAVDTNVKECKEGFLIPPEERDMNHLNACETAYNDWTFGHKWSQYKPQLMELVLAGAISHSITSVLFQAVERSNMKPPQRVSQFFQNTDQKIQNYPKVSKFVSKMKSLGKSFGKGWVPTIISLGSFLTTIEVLAQTPLARWNNKRNIQNNIDDYQSDLEDMIPQIGSSINEHCIFTESDMGSHNYNDFFEDTNIFTKTVTEMFTSIGSSLNDGFSSLMYEIEREEGCSGLKTRNLVAYLSNEWEKYRMIEMGRFNQHFYSWNINTVQSANSYLINTKLFTDVIDFEKIESNIERASYPLYFEGIEFNDNYNDLIREKINNVLSLDVWNSPLFSYNEDNIKKLIDIDLVLFESENFYLNPKTYISGLQRLRALHFLLTLINNNCVNYQKDTPCEKYLGTAVQLTTQIPPPDPYPSEVTDTFLTHFPKIKTAFVCDDPTQSCDEENSLNALPSKLMYYVKIQNQMISNQVEGMRESRHSAFESTFDHFGNTNSFVENAVYQMVCSGDDLDNYTPPSSLENLNCQLTGGASEGSCELEDLAEYNILPSYDTKSFFNLSLGITSFTMPQLTPVPYTPCEINNPQKSFYTEFISNGKHYPNLLSYAIDYSNKDFDWWEEKVTSQHLILFQAFHNEYKKILREDYLENLEPVMSTYRKQIDQLLNISKSNSFFPNSFQDDFDSVLSEIKSHINSESFSKLSILTQEVRLENVQDTIELVQDNISQMQNFQQEVNASILKIKEILESSILKNIQENDPSFIERFRKDGLFLLSEEFILGTLLDYIQSMDEEQEAEFFDRINHRTPNADFYESMLHEDNVEELLQVHNENPVLIKNYIQSCLPSDTSQNAGICNHTLFSPQNVVLLSIAQEILGILRSSQERLREYYYIYGDASLLNE